MRYRKYSGPASNSSSNGELSIENIKNFELVLHGFRARVRRYHYFLGLLRSFGMDLHTLFVAGAFQATVHGSWAVSEGRQCIFDVLRVFYRFSEVCEAHCARDENR